MWEKELEIIDNLGKLYPGVKGELGYTGCLKYKRDKAFWVSWLCWGHLNQRLLHLEKFIKENNKQAWNWYKQDFNITDKQCGKKK